ncbi:hypothetical protein P4641_21495 [Halalkalibacterium halodurans]|nr:hypothetical protein [Halalkalibacterium halodurans]
MAKKKKEVTLKIGKVTYGTMKIEEAYKKALQPYFDERSDVVRASTS